MDQIILKPNEEQRRTLDFIQQTIGLQNAYGADQKTVYWSLEITKQVILLFSLDKLLSFKGFQTQEYRQFISGSYRAVGQNAKKSITKNGFKVLPREEKRVS